MDLAIVVGGVALIAVIVILAMRSLRRAADDAEQPQSEQEALSIERDAVLAALHALETDHDAGNLTPEDFAEQRAALMARGAAILRRLDTLPALPAEETDALEAAIAARRRPVTPALPTNPPLPRPVTAAVAVHANGASEADPFEAAILARRRPLGATRPDAATPIPVALSELEPGSRCSGCGAAAGLGDRFCGACGLALPQPRACNRCGETADPQDRYCGRCGAGLLEETNSV